MAEKQENLHKMKLVESLKKATKDLLSKPHIPIYTYTNLATIKTYLELTTEFDPILSTDPTLFNLSHLVSNLKTELNNLQNSQGYSLKSIFHRLIANCEVSRIVASIEAEVQAWVDQESIKNLVQVLIDSNDDDEEKVEALTRFEKRVSNGFNRELQEMILKAKVFSILEAILSKSKCSIRVFEQSARVIVALVKFNKDVFVGQVLMGPIIRNVVTMASYGSIRVLSSLVKLIRSPLVYEMEAHGYIPRIISLLYSSDLSIGIVALECVFEIALYATKEAVEAMIQEGLIKKLVELQRLESIGDSIDGDGGGGESRGLCEETEEERKMGRGERRLMEEWTFTSCVTRFVVQLEMGEGLELGEKRELKQEILRRVIEASGSDAESTAIVSEVLWGSSPLLR
ncbi:hypothetical protein RHSIM_Rhsim07G0159800 [Rhododendron simsii]|uniref:ARM repeat superfamily protein n=1 Tax=Rhododendron simsii TaxID=118357 RepID=A0A834GQN2_RHOSS|nr:hypothetical protein RHSIM_Rhsim07G0159800 [Rhododendron simsii]